MRNSGWFSATRTFDICYVPLYVPCGLLEVFIVPGVDLFRYGSLLWGLGPISCSPFSSFPLRLQPESQLYLYKTKIHKFGVAGSMIC